MRQNGFSLLETLIYVAIAATSMVVVTAVFISSLQTKSVITAQQLLLDAERVAEQQIVSRLEEAGQVLAPAAAGFGATLTIDSPTASESPVTFSLADETLQMMLGTASSVPITPERVRVTDFSVERLEGTPPTLAISITTAADTGGGRTISHLSEITYTLRYE